MNAETVGTRLESAFPDRIRWTARTPRRLYALIPADALLDVFEYCRTEIPGFRLGTSTAIDLPEGAGVFHHCVVNGLPLVVTLKVVVPKPDPVVPSLAKLVPAADWIEREMHDLLDITFEGHPDPRRLVKAEAFPDTFPARRDFDPAAFKESIGERPDY